MVLTDFVKLTCREKRGEFVWKVILGMSPITEFSILLFPMYSLV